ncbi:MAG: histidine phosphotransferase family protein [Rhodospirillaceae bacterium]|nr:histidine phosphotransferase family protein [Rhodospirillaceae bacterium]
MADHVQLAQLIATRLCHDLAGPVGAVAAGVELIGDDPAAVDAETLALIGNSSAAASRKLKFLRTAFGTPASASPAALGEAHATVAGYLTATAGPGGPPELNWPSRADLSAAQDRIGPGMLQVLFNLLILALESVPRCHRLSVEVDAQTPRLRVAASSTASRDVPDRAGAPRSDIAAVVATPDAALPSARTAQALYAVAAARALGGRLALAPADGGLAAEFAPDLAAGAGSGIALKSGG